MGFVMHRRLWQVAVPIFAATMTIAFAHQAATAAWFSPKSLEHLRSGQEDQQAQVDLAQYSHQGRRRQSLVTRRSPALVAKQSQLAAKKAQAEADKIARAKTRKQAEEAAAAKKKTLAGIQAVKQAEAISNQVEPTSNRAALVQNLLSNSQREKWISEISRVLRRVHPGVEPAKIRVAAERALNIPDENYVAVSARHGNLKPEKADDAFEVNEAAAQAKATWQAAQKFATARQVTEDAIRVQEALQKQQATRMRGVGSGMPTTLTTW